MAFRLPPPILFAILLCAGLLLGLPRMMREHGRSTVYPGTAESHSAKS